MADRSLILGSASPRRRHLMAKASYRFDVVAPEAEELTSTEKGLIELVKENSLLKAQWVARRNPTSIVIGADTLVCIEGDALGKPADHAEATRMLRRLSGKTHEVCTGVALICEEEEAAHTFHVATGVTFRELTNEQIATYFSKVNPLDKAGAYGAQEHGDDIIDRIAGSWSNVIGLPMEELARELEAFISRTRVTE